jgi:hypothetical protein
LGAYLPQAWREEKSARRRRDAKKKLIPLRPAYRSLGAFAPLRAKKEDLHVYHIGRNRYQNKLACHRQGVKKNNSTFFLTGTLSLTFAL